MSAQMMFLTLVASLVLLSTIEAQCGCGCAGGCPIGLAYYGGNGCGNGCGCGCKKREAGFFPDEPVIRGRRFTTLYEKLVAENSLK